jgi:hypothetical protein
VEFGFFVDHGTFIAGLLYAAVHGPGPLLASGRRFLGARTKSEQPCARCSRAAGRPHLTAM